MNQPPRYAIYNHQNRTYYTEEGLWSPIQENAKHWPTRDGVQNVVRLFLQTQEPVRVVEV
jgi:hypothetical protein